MNYKPLPPIVPVAPVPGFENLRNLNVPIYYEMPVGSIILFAGKIFGEENGEYQTDLQRFHWKVCDGSSLQADEYPELFNALGYLYGGENGTLKLPDLRGKFLRGVGKDDASTEKRDEASKYGSKTGVGSTQGFAMQNHKHQYTMPFQTGAGGQGTAINSTTTKLTTVPNKISKELPEIKVSVLETRPVNTFIYFLIKCK
jgi:microcystin-dependent protein